MRILWSFIILFLATPVWAVGPVLPANCTMSWNEAGDLTTLAGFNVYLSPTSGGAGVKVGTVPVSAPPVPGATYTFACPSGLPLGSQQYPTVTAFNSSGVETPRSSEFPFVVAQAPSPPTTSQPPVGYLDGVSGNINGWAADPDVPTTMVRVQLYLDGVVIATVPTDQPSPDIAAAFPQYTGTHRFKYPIPASAADGKPHTVRAVALDDKVGGPSTELNGSPMSFTLVPPPPPPVTPSVDVKVTCTVGAKVTINGVLVPCP